MVPPSIRTGAKAMVLKSLPLDDMNTIVLAIRGSQSAIDWAINFQPAPTPPTGFLDDEMNLCHAGFLAVARAMVAPTAARLRALVAANPARGAASLLITGHSAGGAVAQLLYAHMLSSSPALAASPLRDLAPLFKRVHCVTFGAPPLSLLPLGKPALAPHLAGNPDAESRRNKSLFFAFVNEGDPVARADLAVVSSLLRLYVAPAPASAPSLALQKLGGCAAGQQQQRRRPDWPVPPSTLSLAGSPVVLLRTRPELAGRVGPTDGRPENVQACVVGDGQLRGAVFGDPVAHVMDLYKRRVEGLAVRAVTAS